MLTKSLFDPILDLGGEGVWGVLTDFLAIADEDVSDEANLLLITNTPFTNQEMKPDHDALTKGERLFHRVGNQLDDLFAGRGVAGQKICEPLGHDCIFPCFYSYVGLAPCPTP